MPTAQYLKGELDYDFTKSTTPPSVLGPVEEINSTGIPQWNVDSYPHTNLTEDINVQTRIVGSMQMTGILFVNWVSFIDFLGLDVESTKGFILTASSTVCDVIFNAQPKIVWNAAKSTCYASVGMWLKTKTEAPVFPVLTLELDFIGHRHSGENAIFFVYHHVSMAFSKLKSLPWSMDYDVPRKPKYWFVRKYWRKFKTSAKRN